MLSVIEGKWPRNCDCQVVFTAIKQGMYVGTVHVRTEREGEKKTSSFRVSPVARQDDRHYYTVVPVQGDRQLSSYLCTLGGGPPVCSCCESANCRHIYALQVLRDHMLI